MRMLTTDIDMFFENQFLPLSGGKRRKYREDNTKLIERLTNDVAPNEEKGIKVLGGWIIRVLNERLRVSEETKTRRNKLVRHLREEIERLKK